MLLPFTAQILHLLEDSPADVTTGALTIILYTAQANSSHLCVTVYC